MISLSVVKNEIDRLRYTVDQIKEHGNPHKLDVPFMEACADALQVYYDLHRPPENTA